MNELPPGFPGFDPSALIVAGLDRVIGDFDCGPLVGRAADSIRLVCSEEKEGIAHRQRPYLTWPEDPPPELTELLSLLHVQHLAVLAGSAAILHARRGDLAGTGSPVKYLSRPMFETVAYLAYLLADNQPSRTADYVASEVMMREWILERAAGAKRWSRSGSDNAPDAPAPPRWVPEQGGSRPTDLKKRADEYECDWTRRAIESVGAATNRRELKRADLTGLRASWKRLRHAPGTAAAQQVTYRERCSVWKLIATWPAGVKPHEAAKAAGLHSRFYRLPPDVDPEAAESLMCWSNWTAANPYAHASPFNIGPSEASDREIANTALFVTYLMMEWATQVVASRYQWGRRLEPAISEVRDSLARTALGEGTRNLLTEMKRGPE